MKRAKDALHRAEQDEADRAEQGNAAETSANAHGDDNEDEDEDDGEPAVNGGVHEYSPGEEEAGFPYEYNGDGDEAERASQGNIQGATGESIMQRQIRPFAVPLNASVEEMLTEVGSEPDMDSYFFDDFPEETIRDEAEVDDGEKKPKDKGRQVPAPAPTSDAPLPGSEF